MVTDEQVRRLRKLSNTEKNQEICSVEGGDGPDHSAAVFGSGTVAQRTEEGTAVADPRGSVWRGVGRRSAADPGESRTVGITLGGQIFDHLVYHFVLTHSN